MANSITVNTATLRSKASELRQSNAQFKQQVESLTTQEESLNSMWEGDANDAFHGAFTKDITQMNNFYNAIEKYVTSLEEIAKQYDETEKANQSIASARKY
ncbi:MAG TPA: hypothetical protein DDY31_19470 [Lachnospiraceae bacterium]|nr:hypothetical protein [Lachnospiraceae bacterium]